MLSTNVLCIKKRKKRSYCITGGRSSSSSSEYAPTPDKNKRSVGGAAAMLHITEDTPPDMLAGAMDLTVHLPTGRSVKMSAERSTPMMDLLVQITNNNRLQLSEYTLQALGMEPSSERGDKVLPFKPNTPIGALDTQHIRVVPKSRTVPVPKNIPPGHQPFESTFRLKVHLPRNQLYVTRVSQSVHLEDIMKKVCEEKNLDPIKYEFRHPGNLDETLDPKLTLSDYKITEVCIVLKGTAGLNQTFTTNDIMALRKEEERKQMHNKTGGGVFNLIFRRGNKQSSGSLSSENRSISPTHSDDSRSVTPPAIQNQIVAPRPQQEPEAPAERPKPPQRKRRPAPKPPQVKAEDKVEAPTKIEDPKQEDTSGLTICHSRNSSDSSGYHEASILSDNCNTSLPRRPKSTVITEEAGDEFGSKMSGAYSQSASNLTKMSSHSKSTSSLAFPSRKKKSAPAPPPPVLKATNSVTTLDFNDKKPSPVVASQPLQTPQSSSSSLAQSAIIIDDSNGCGNDTVNTSTNPVSAPRTHKAPPVPRPRHAIPSSSKRNSLLTDAELPQEITNEIIEVDDEEEIPEAWNPQVLQEIHTNVNQVNEALNPDFETRMENSEDEIRISQIKLHELQKVDDNLFTHLASPTIEETPEQQVLAYFDEKVKADEELKISQMKLKELQKVDNNFFKNLTSPTKEEISEHQGQAVFEEKMTADEELKISQMKLKELQKVDNNFFKNLSSPTSEEIPENQVPTTFEEKVQTGEEELRISQMKLKELQKIDNNLFKNLASPTREERPIVEEVAKPPEVVGVSYKQQQRKERFSRSIFDSYTRKRGFQIGSSLLADNSDDTTDDEIKKSSLSTTNSVASALNSFAFVDEIDDLNHEMFTGSLSKHSGTEASVILDQLHGMHDYERLPKNPSLSSLRSVNSLPGFLSGGAANGTMKKWSNEEDLDDISLQSSTNERQAWVVGDHSDTESGHSTANESPPVTVASNDLNTPDQSPPVSETVEDRTREAEEVKEEVPPPVVPSEKVVQKKEDVGEHDLDWHYRLPSPPKAFRDSSPARFEDTVTTTYESADVTDSVVTSPELFEKLKVIKDNQDGISDLTSIVSEEDQNKPILSTLSLEHLEKRKSLVYNRELATSLKSAAPTPSPVNNSGLDVDDTVMRKTKNNAETFSSSVTTFEKTYEEMRRSSQQKESNNRNTLPNFKITTYDKPKPKLNIFEDDTIRSNEKNPSNGNNSRRQSEESKPMSDNNFAGRSVENVRRNSANVEEDVKKPAEYKFYRPNRPPTHNHKSQYVSVLRSESLSHKDLDNWSPSRPVTRSKSQVALNKYLEKNAPNADPEEENLSKGNSLFDLQSIGVMRLIQTKLNTPTSSMEGLNKIEGASYQRQPETKPKEVQREEPKPAYHYRPSPSINMGTWSDRPKIPVNVKDDPDYKFGKLIVTTSNNDVKSNNTVEVNRSNNFNVKVNNQDYNNRNVSIKVNGSEPISAQNTGNVVIKIGQKQTVNLRRPLGTLDKNEQRHHQIRPHSIAFGGESDDNQSRIPFVRSVELKKPFKDTKPTNNTSITPIFHNNNNNSYSTQTLNRNGNYSFGKINDYNNTSSHNNHNIEVTHQNNISNKPNFRVNSFVQNSAPVVRGFRSDSVSETNRWSHHQQPHSFASTTATNNNNNNIKEVGNKKFNTKIVTPVPFSQVTLRRTEFNSTSQPPPAPPPMKVAVNIKSPLGNNNFNNGPVDSKEQLLQAIRDFGGKKGLKAVKA